MAYELHNFQNGDIIQAADINEMDQQIKENADSGVSFEEFETETISTEIDVPTNGAKLMTIVLEFPQGAESTNYGYMYVNGLKSGFGTTSFISKDEKRRFRIVVQKITDDLWMYRSYKGGFEHIYNFNSGNNIGNTFIGMEVERIGVATYGSDKFPVGVKVMVVRGTAI